MIAYAIPLTKIREIIRFLSLGNVIPQKIANARMIIVLNNEKSDAIPNRIIPPIHFILFSSRKKYIPARVAAIASD